MFWQVGQSNYNQKKVQSSGCRVECLGVPWARICFWRVPQSNYNRKKGTVVWPSVVMFGGFHELRLFWRVCHYGFWRVPRSNYKLRLEKKGYSCLAISWNVYYVLLTNYTLVDRPSAMTPWEIYPGRKIPALTSGLLVPSARRGLRKDTVVDGWRLRRCRPSYSSIAYTICNTRNILFWLCLYLKRGNKLNVGIVWFEGKAPSWTFKTCLTMVEPFAGPSSMAMGNQLMPLRYPLCKRLSKGGVRGFLLTLWSGG